MHGGIHTIQSQFARDVTVRAVVGPTGQFADPLPSVLSHSSPSCFQTFFWYVFASDFGPDSARDPFVRRMAGEKESNAAPPHAGALQQWA